MRRLSWVVVLAGALFLSFAAMASGQVATASVTFVIDVTNDGYGLLGPGDFTVDLTRDPAGSPTVTSHVDGDAVTIDAAVSYQVGSVMPERYALTGVVCVDDSDSSVVSDASGVFTPSPGQAVTCTVNVDDVNGETFFELVSVVINDDGGTATAEEYTWTCGWGGIGIDCATPHRTEGDLSMQGGFHFLDLEPLPTPSTGYEFMGIVCTYENGDVVVVDSVPGPLPFLRPYPGNGVSCAITMDDLPAPDVPDVELTVTKTVVELGSNVVRIGAPFDISVNCSSGTGSVPTEAFQLDDGESLTFAVPEGSHCLIVEQHPLALSIYCPPDELCFYPARHSVSINGQSGMSFVTEPLTGPDYTVDIVNTYEEGEPITGTLLISKTVEDGPGIAPETFDLIVECAFSDGTPGFPDGDTRPYQIGDGETITVNDIYSGATCTITEPHSPLPQHCDEFDNGWGYCVFTHALAVSFNGGEPQYTYYVGSDVVAPPVTYTFVAEAMVEIQTVEIDNTYVEVAPPKYRTLTIAKEVTGNAAPTGAEATIRLDCDVPIPQVFARDELSETFVLGDGETAEWTIPIGHVGTDCTLTESKPTVPEGSVWSVNVNGTASRTYVFTFTEDQTVTFVNLYQKVLPDTGFQVSAPVWFGFTLLAIGIAVVTVTRRRAQLGSSHKAN